MKPQHWLGALATAFIATAVMLAAIDGRAFETSAYIVVLMAVVEQTSS